MCLVASLPLDYYDLQEMSVDISLHIYSVVNEPWRIRTAWCRRPRSAEPKLCGAERDRTDDLRLAKPALSQLSYSPVGLAFSAL